jgi:ribosomal protein S27E
MTAIPMIETDGRSVPTQIVPGARFNRLTAMRPERHPSRRGTFWRCKCDCGNEPLVYAAHLRNGQAKGCGCAKKGVNRTHGMSHSPEYRAWDNARSRCYREKDAKFPLYGSRGIRMCDRWRHSFENFLADMGRRPSPGHSLERKNSDGHYEPANCVWATATEQNNMGLRAQNRTL